MRRLLASAIAVVAALGLGALLGVIWEAIAPRVLLVVAADGKLYPEGYEPEGYMTDDGIAAVLCVVAGLVVGLATVWAARRIAPGDNALLIALAAVVVLGAAGSLALWWTGQHLGGFDLEAVVASSSEGAAVTAPLRLRMPGVLVLWPLMSVTVVFLAALGDWWRGRSQERIDALA